MFVETIILKDSQDSDERHRDSVGLWDSSVFSTHDVSSPCEVREHGGRATGVYGTHCEGCVLEHGSHCEIGCVNHIVRMYSLGVRITVRGDWVH